MAFNTRGGAHSQPMAEINTTPLVDVMLVLLVVFIICAPVLQQAVVIDLPQASATPLPASHAPLHLALDAQGDLLWEGQPLGPSELEQRLHALNPDTELQLLADHATPYQRLAEVMAAAQRAGIVKLAFVTAPPR